MTEATATGRHSTFFELKEALAKPGCPICKLSARSVRRYLESLAFESVNDIAVRGQLRRTRGFCNLHAWQLLEDAREPFGAAIIYRDVLNACVGAVTRGEFGALIGVGTCPACQTRGAAAGRYLDTLIDHLHDREIANALSTSGGLCWRHFGMGMGRGGRGLRTLATVELAAMKSVTEGRSRQAPAGSSRPAPGVRAGNAAPRPAPDDDLGDPLVAAAVGLRGQLGPFTVNVAAHDWAGDGRAGEAGGGGKRSEWDECGMCLAARRGVEAAVMTLAAERRAAMEICPAHAWLVYDRVGATPLRTRLAQQLQTLAERVTRAEEEIRTAESVGVGPLAFATPAAKKARSDLALKFAMGRDCIICQAQMGAEATAVLSSSGRVCRPHLNSALAKSPPVDPQYTVQHWKELVASLDEYIRKNDYRFRGEPRGSEQRSPWRAVAAVAGGPGLR